MRLKAAASRVFVAFITGLLVVAGTVFGGFAGLNAAAATDQSVVATSNTLAQTQECTPVDSTGQLTWSFKDSWVNYLQKEFTKGSATSIAPATVTGDMAVTYLEDRANSTYDRATKTGVIAYSGGVNYRGHEGLLDVTFTNPQITVQGNGSATLSIEVSVTDSGNTKDVGRQDVAAIPALPDGVIGETVQWQNVTGELTKSLGEASHYFEIYTGEQASPLTFSAGYTVECDNTPGGPAAPTDPAGSDAPGTTPEQPACTPTGTPGQLTWRLRDSWQNYLVKFAKATVKPHGSATVAADGAVTYQQDHANSTYSHDTKTGVLAYTGGVYIEGHKGLMKLAMVNPQIDVKSNATAVLSLEISKTDSGGFSDITRVDVAILTLPAPTVDEVTTWANATTVFVESDGWFGKQYGGETGAPLTFSAGVKGVECPDTKPADPKPEQPETPNTPGTPGDTANPSNPNTPKDPEKPSDPAPNPGGTNTLPELPAKNGGSLQWGVKHSFREYINGRIAKGSYTAGGAASIVNGIFNFPQAVGGVWNKDNNTGTIQYAGSVRFTGHHGVLDLSFFNPLIVVHNDRFAQMLVPFNGSTVTLIDIDLASAQKTVSPSGNVTWVNAPTRLTASGVPVFAEFYKPGEVLDPISFTYGAPTAGISSVPAQTATTFKASDLAAGQAPGRGSRAVLKAGQGSFNWGISTSFARYVAEGYVVGRATPVNTKGRVIGTCVNGDIGSYSFPQTGGNFDPTTELGTIEYSGTVQYWAHGGLLNQSFSNPVVNVTSPTTATLSANGTVWGTINLGTAAKQRGSNGEITWSGATFTPGAGASSFLGSEYNASGKIGWDSEITFTAGSAADTCGTGTNSESKKKEKDAAAAEQVSEIKEAKAAKLSSAGKGSGATSAKAVVAPAQLPSWMWYGGAGVLALLATGVTVTAIRQRAS